MYWISGTAIAFIVVLTVCDVILRRFRMPISCTYEIVTFVGAIAIALAIPYSTLIGSQISMEFITDKVSGHWQKILYLTTRCLGLGIFIILTWRLFILGNNFKQIGDVTPILEIPMYPVPYIIGIACITECFVLAHSIFLELAKTEDKTIKR